MKVKGLPAYCLLTILAIPIVSSRGFDMQRNGKPVQAKSPREDRGVVSEGFQLLAEMERFNYQLGAPIPLKLTVKNTSSRTLKLPVSYPEVEYKVTIKDEKGGLVPLTEYGEGLKKPLPIPRNYLREMEPGEQMSEWFPIHKVFNITGSGIYSVSVQRRILRQRDKKLAEVESKAVQFRVSN
jgi:hypothetical protein